MLLGNIRVQGVVWNERTTRGVLASSRIRHSLFIATWASDAGVVCNRRVDYTLNPNP